MSTFIGVHGAWSAAWAWWRLHRLFLESGRRLLTPTCTGLGDRAHLLQRGVDLALHIEDVVRVLECEDLTDVVLVGHSYGGMVVTGVADRVPERIRHLVYLDALLPEHGECAMDLLPATQRSAVEHLVQERGEGWLIPAPPLPPDTPNHDVRLAVGRRLPQPLATFTSPIVLLGRGESVPTTYIRCTVTGPFDTFGLSWARARARAGWSIHELTASHNPHITMPEGLATLLWSIAD